MAGRRRHRLSEGCRRRQAPLDPASPTGRLLPPRRPCRPCTAPHPPTARHPAPRARCGLRAALTPPAPRPDRCRWPPSGSPTTSIPPEQAKSQRTPSPCGRPARTCRPRWHPQSPGRRPRIRPPPSRPIRRRPSRSPHLPPPRATTPNPLPPIPCSAAASPPLFRHQTDTPAAPRRSPAFSGSRQLQFDPRGA